MKSAKMPSAQPASHSNTHPSPVRTVAHIPYFTPATLQALLDAAFAAQSSSSKSGASKAHSSRRATACGFIAALSSRLGFPQKTTAGAQYIYHRFHLGPSRPPSDFVVHEVAIASLLLSSKLNDTPKKTKETLLASFALRYPELVKPPQTNLTDTAAYGTSGQGTFGNSNNFILGSVAEADVDANVLEMERKRLLALERLMLESIGFDFALRERVRECFSLVVKLSRKWKLSSQLSAQAWRVSADTYRTYAPLIYPPIALAIASIYVAALLFGKSPTSEIHIKSNGSPDTESSESEADTLISYLSSGSSELSVGIGESEGSWNWLSDLHSYIGFIEDIAHMILDTYIAAASSITTPTASSGSFTPVSPGTPLSPAEHAPETIDTHGKAGSSSRQKRLPPHAFSPPPLGVLSWLKLHAPPMVATEFQRGPQDLVSELTYVKIRLRKAEDQRQLLEQQPANKGSMQDSSVDQNYSHSQITDFERQCASATQTRRMVAAERMQQLDLELEGKSDELSRARGISKERHSKHGTTRFLF